MSTEEFNIQEETFEVRDLREKDKFVVDDKFLNGYARFLGIYAVGVYVCLCRHADKDQKTYPAINKIAEELDISRNKVIEAIKCLEFWKIIKKKRVGLKLTNRYYLLKKSLWKAINEENLREFSEVYHKDFRSLCGKLQEFTTGTSIVRKHNSKETQKKGIILHSKPEFAGSDINYLIGLFKEINPNYERLFANKTQRSALERLVGKFGKEKVERMIKFLPEIFSRPYAPTITTPLELEKKLANLIAFLQKEKMINEQYKIAKI